MALSRINSKRLHGRNLSTGVFRMREASYNFACAVWRLASTAACFLLMASNHQWHPVSCQRWHSKCSQIIFGHRRAQNKEWCFLSRRDKSGWHYTELLAMPANCSSKALDVLWAWQTFTIRIWFTHVHVCSFMFTPHTSMEMVKAQHQKKSGVAKAEEKHSIPTASALPPPAAFAALQIPREPRTTSGRNLFQAKLEASAHLWARCFISDKVNSSSMSTAWLDLEISGKFNWEKICVLVDR